MPSARTVMEFEITLRDVAPRTWRRIEVPSTYTFWDLHVAIQDAMGWQDSHLHRFEVINRATFAREEIGIPDEDGWEMEVKVHAGWTVPIGAYFITTDVSLPYTYDFGDDWQHDVRLVAIRPRVAGEKYPRCTGGEFSCPPEDCGGAPGYERFQQIVANRRHKEHKEMLAWAGGHFDAFAFDAARVKFDDPKKRWRRAFGPGAG